jgi:hypothetical protein
MTIIEKILLAQWAGIPLVLWSGFILLGAIGIRRGLRIKFKGRDREIEIETVNEATHKKVSQKSNRHGRHSS